MPFFINVNWISDAVKLDSWSIVTKFLPYGARVPVILPEHLVIQLPMVVCFSRLQKQIVTIHCSCKEGSQWLKCNAICNHYNSWRTKQHQHSASPSINLSAVSISLHNKLVTTNSGKQFHSWAKIGQQANDLFAGWHFTVVHFYLAVLECRYFSRWFTLLYVEWHIPCVMVCVVSGCFHCNRSSGLIHLVLLKWVVMLLSFLNGYALQLYYFTWVTFAS